METIEKRISEALENELSAIYEEEGIETGDITPLQLLEWDRLVSEAANLFCELINQNK